MRLLRLDLEKYGAFEGRSLDFRPDAKLHVVFGPNEAGKSSALAAVSDLLFGFGARTDFAFRHAMGDLRLGATVRGADGSELAFRRRKGNKATLVGPDDAPLRDDLLAPLLGALSREIFERAFGLTTRALREGGEALLDADGEAGASLFAASSGLRGLEELRRSLEAEADALFSPQARTKPFNDLLRRHDAARKRLHELELGASAWRRLNDSIEALEARHAAMTERLKSVRTERARIERLELAQSAAASVEAARRELAACGEAPEIPPRLAEELARRLDAVDAAAAEAARSAEALARAEAELSGTAVDDAALAAADSVKALVELSGAYLAHQRDLPRVQREADGLAEQLTRLATRLGLADVESVERALPADASLAALKELVEEGRELARAGAERRSALEDERARLAKLRAARGPEAPVDPRPLQEAFAALQPRLKPLERREELAAETAREDRALADAAARMSPPIDDLDRLATRPMPGAEAIAQARRDDERLAAEIARAEEALAKDAGEIIRAEAALDALAEGEPIASPETVAVARAARDAAWTPLRAHLLGAAALPADELRDRVAALDRETAAADRLADRLAEDADRLARRSQLFARRAELARVVEAGRARLADLASRREAAAQAWAEMWDASGVAPVSPEVMDGWRKELAILFGRREQNEERRAALARLDAAEAALRPSLLRLAQGCGLEDEPIEGALALAARIGRRLSALVELWSRADKDAAQVADLEERVARLEREETAAELAAQAHRVRWRAALPVLALPQDVSFASAEAALDAWREAPGLISERQNRLGRVRGMRRDAEAFAEGVGRLVAEVAPDLGDLPPDAALRRLDERAAAARDAETRRDEARRRRADAATRDAEARRKLDAARLELAEAGAGLPADIDLRELLARGAARERLRATLGERLAHLLQVGRAADERALAAELEGFDPDTAPAAIEALKVEEERLAAEDREVFAELDRERRRRDALGGADAERAAAEQRAAAAALGAMAREWAVLKVAGLLLGTAVERAHAADRNPTLERAAGLFETLTGGAFSGFAEDYDKDEPRLVARRASGEKVAIPGLSEGTRDQFYLALRLAAVEDYASRAAAPPFIADDLFASFDDARTAQGLRALAEIGGRVQPILFTHHRAVVEAARGALGREADVIELEPFRP
jgi:uncharacterized protein YhaN